MGLPRRPALALASLAVISQNAPRALAEISDRPTTAVERVVQLPTETLSSTTHLKGCVPRPRPLYFCQTVAGESKRTPSPNSSAVTRAGTVTTSPGGHKSEEYLRR